MYGALEAGGTKMIAAVFDEEGSLLTTETFKTETPADTMPKLISFFQEHPVRSLGIGSFGPLNLIPCTPGYGSITCSPKQAWREYPILAAFKVALAIPVGIDTDVNAAALGEGKFGSGKNADVIAYVTVGTGIGAGILINKKPLHGAMHPEFGHILLSPHNLDPLPDGICPYHKHCLEGLASGPSMEARWGKPASLITDELPWMLEAEYLAQAAAILSMTVSPQKIIFGGGVMKHRALFPLIRNSFSKYVNGYLQNPSVEDLDSYIVSESLDGNQALLGCLDLAKEAELNE